MMRTPTPFDLAASRIASLITRTRSPEQGQAAAWKRLVDCHRVVGPPLRKLQELNVIHVTGSKGKGTTCAMVESILRHSGYRTGLFTSPHLCDVRERIRIDGELVDQDTFTQRANWIYDRLEKAHKEEEIALPGYFQFLTLLALNIFSNADLDVVVLEVGIGGRYSATNIIPSPLVCGVTPISLEHTSILGNTLGEIAFEKSGIFKPSAEAYTAAQFSETLQVLQRQAKEIGIPLVNISHIPEFKNLNQLQDANHMLYANATLAVHIARSMERRLWAGRLRPELRQQYSAYQQRMEDLYKDHIIPQSYLTGLNNFERAGRWQRIRDDVLSEQTTFNSLSPPKPSNLTFYLDGAHTVESLRGCMSWFGSQDKSSTCDTLQFLLFISSEVKETEKLLKAVLTGMQSHDITFNHVFFVPPSLPKYNTVGELQNERTHLQTWIRLRDEGYSQMASPLLQIDPSDFVDTSDLKQNCELPVSADVFPSVISAIGWFRQFARSHRKSDIRVLVTGTLYLAGDVLKILGRVPK